MHTFIYFTKILPFENSFAILKTWVITESKPTVVEPQWGGFNIDAYLGYTLKLESITKKMV